MIVFNDVALSLIKIKQRPEVAPRQVGAAAEHGPTKHGEQAGPDVEGGLPGRTRRAWSGGLVTAVPGRDL